MSYENNNINSSSFPDKIVSSNDEFKPSETAYQSSHQLIQSNESSHKIPSSSSENSSILLHHNSPPEQNPSLTNQITIDSNSHLLPLNISSPLFIPKINFNSNSSLSPQNFSSFPFVSPVTFDSNSSLSQNISSPPLISNTSAETTPSLISQLQKITTYQLFVSKQKSFLKKSDFVTSPITNSITPNLNFASYKNTSFNNSDLKSSDLSMYAKFFVPKLGFKIDERYEIENGIIGIKRDCFLKLTRYMEYINKRKLRSV
jgi:hypothetical protein